MKTVLEKPRTVRITITLQNPRLKQIHLRALSNWKALMEFHRTKNIKWIQQLLGHKDLETTVMHIQLISLESAPSGIPLTPDIWKRKVN